MKQVSVITGGGSGIGRAAGLALAAAGHHVVFCGRTRQTLDESVELAGSGAALVLDVTDEGEVDAAFGDLERVDVLVNSAGCSARSSRSPRPRWPTGRR